VRAEQEITGDDPFPDQVLSLSLVETVDREQSRDGLACPLGVGLEKVESPDGGPESAEVTAVCCARGDQSLDRRDEEGAGSTGRLEECARAEILVGRVADQIKDQVDHPSTGEDLAVVGAWIGGELSEGHGVLDEGELSQG